MEGRVGVAYIGLSRGCSELYVHLALVVRVLTWFFQTFLPQFLVQNFYIFFFPAYLVLILHFFTPNLIEVRLDFLLLPLMLFFFFFQFKF